MTVKINADTSDGLKIVSDTSGAIDLQSNGTTNASLDANGNFTHKGIEVDMWRQTDTLSANNGVLGVDSGVIRVDDATFSKIGTGMSVTSGKWTFPRTGVYEIKVQAFWVCAAGDSAIVQTRGSSDDGSNYDVLAWASGGDLDNTKGSFYSQCFFNCTNTSTHKVQFNCISIGSGSELQGSSNENVTSLSFIRLGDSQ
jgi:hypothetical protein